MPDNVHDSVECKALILLSCCSVQIEKRLWAAAVSPDSSLATVEESFSPRAILLALSTALSGSRWSKVGTAKS